MTGEEQRRSGRESSKDADSRRCLELTTGGREERGGKRSKGRRKEKGGEKEKEK